jgi:hypothetical protein
MPVAIDMGFPTLILPLSDTVTLSGLFDSCGSLNLGWMPFHLNVMEKYPELVAEFRYFDGSQPFEPVHLSGAVLDPTSVSPDHGKLTALIRYRTNFVLPDNTAFTISFALGPDVAANTIIGLPFHRSLKFITDYDAFTAHSKLLNHTFQLSCSSSERGLPPGSAFDHTAFLQEFLTAQKCSFRTSQRPTSPHLNTAALANDATCTKATDDMSQGFLRRTILPTPAVATVNTTVQL